MKERKKLLFAVCFLFLVGSSVSCRFDNVEQKNIYKNNDKIAAEGDNYAFRNNISKLRSKDSFDTKYGYFSGDYKVWALKAKEDSEITFNYDSTVKDGNFKAVLIGPNKEVENIFEGSDKDSKTIKLAKGEYSVKIVGRDAKGELKFSNNAGKNIEVLGRDDFSHNIKH